jgi:TP901 family phage tail tape measure protein
MGYSFTVKDIVDPNAIEEVKKLGKAFDDASEKYATLAKALADSTKINPKTLGELKQKSDDYGKAMQEVAKVQAELSKLQKDYQELLAKVNQQTMEGVRAKTEEAKANKLNAEAELANSRAKTETLKQDKLITQQSKNRKASEEEVTKALTTQAQSIAQATEQNKILRQAVKDVVGVDQQAFDQRTKLNAKIDQNTAFIKRNSDAYTKQKMTIGDYKEQMKIAWSEIKNGENRFSNLGIVAKGFGGILKENVSSGLKQVTSGVGNMIKGFIGAQAIIGAFQKLIGQIKAGVSAIVDFEAANSKLAAILGTLPKNIRELTADSKRLGAETKYTATQVAELQIELAKLGFTRREILAATESVLKFAQATDAGLGEAAALAGASLRMFGADAEETKRYVSAMAVATSKSALSFSYLQTAMPIAGAAANQFGFEIEDVLALLGTLADAGIQSSMAATATRNIFLNIANESGKLNKAMGGNIKTLDDFVRGLGKINDGGAKLAELLELTDKRSVVAFSNFISGAQKIEKLRKSITGVEDDLDQMAKTMGDNVRGSMFGLSSAWEALFLSISNSTGAIKSAIDWLTRLIRSVAGFIDESKSAIDVYEDHIDAAARLNTETVDLVGRYIELTKNTERSASEQEELNKVIGKLVDTVPEAANEFDEYGRVVGLNTDVIYDYIKAHTAMLRILNAKAIEDAEENIGKLSIRAKYLYTLMNEGKTIRVEGFSETYKLEGEELRKVQKEYQETMTELRGYEELKKKYTGQSETEALMRRSFDQMSIESLKEWINAEENAGNEYMKIANQTLEAKKIVFTADLNNMNKVELEKWIADEKNANSEFMKIAKERLATMGNSELTEEQKKQARERERIQKELNASELALMDEGLEKELKKIRDNYTHKIALILGTSKEEQKTRENIGKEMQNALNKATTDYSLNEEKQAIENRLMVVKAGSEEEYKLRMDLIDLQEQLSINSGSHSVLLEEKFQNDRLNLMQKYASEQTKLLQEQYAQDSIIATSVMQEELGELEIQYNKGLINRENYEKRKLEIVSSYAIEEAKAAVSLLEDQLKIANLSETERENIEKKLFEAKMELYDAEVKARQDADNAIIDSEKRKLENISSTIEKVGEFLNEFADLGSALFERRVQELEEEQEANQAAHDAEIARIERLAEIGAISTEESEARKRAAEDATARKEAELERKKAELKTKQAKFDKANSLAQAMINTAASILASAQMGYPAAIPFIAMAAAMGAIQTAIILATPLPKYAKGTDRHPGGLAVVGDGGRSETVIMPTGQKWITPAIPTLVDLPRNTIVKPDTKDLINFNDLIMSGLKSDVGMIEAGKDEGIYVNVSTDTVVLERELKEIKKLLKDNTKRQRKASIDAELNYKSSLLKPI